MVLDKYKNFYGRFHDSWLSEKLEKSMIRIWQKGDFLSKYNHFSCVTGETLFTTIYISNIIGLDPFKYVDKKILMNLYAYDGGNERVYKVLSEMKRKASELDAQDLFQTVLHEWFYSIVSYEGWDKSEVEYYKGMKQKRMYKFLNELGWDAFGKVGIQPSKWEKHTVSLYVKACPRVLGDEKTCAAFEKGATKYGFYTPVTEKVENAVEKEIAAFTVDLQNKLDGIL